MSEYTKVIWKYTLKFTSDHHNILMPDCAEILSVQNQCGDICMWVLVDPKEKGSEERSFVVYGTGHDIDRPQDLRYVGTTQHNNGVLVLHVFEIMR